ncbi:MAG TPA: hypothetical protein DHD79_06360 [Firmicutes bacterium]|jgi:uncharacterized protein YebE (UPF0316 family)|nr:hypothetical protein [Bacillota bacterium]HBE07427.1 hypothetical protein [Bacillota bacterium]HBG43937.1 hypothetical protein [Bacillota bacterium]HBL48735.1 hypothetical protein [Bacillota bacterium]HBL68359.1 hypothetical protein [Bacillota bacterium]
MDTLLNSGIFNWVVLPALIFLARVVDVSLGTIRIILVSKGQRFLAPLLGFFEAMIWLVAIGQVMQNLSNALCYLAYGAGFAIGNYVGIVLEERLAMGHSVIRIVTAKETTPLVDKLVEAQYGVTSVEAKGATGDVMLIYTIIKRKDLPEVVRIINEFDKKAFYSIEDARTAKEGVFPKHTHSHRPPWVKPFVGRIVK